MYRTILCFVFKDTATTEIYTYRHTPSLHDALPIYPLPSKCSRCYGSRSESMTNGYFSTPGEQALFPAMPWQGCSISSRSMASYRMGSDLLFGDRKSTRLNSSH